MSDATPTVVTSPGAVADKPVRSAKPWYKSKTLYAAVLTAVAPWVPFVGPWVVANPQLFPVALGAIFSLLRVITKDRLVIS